MKTILIIDDNQEFRETLRDRLEREGYNILEAPQGKKGMEILKKNSVELVVTDIFMPEKDGIEAITEIKKYYPRIKIIAISGGGRNVPTSYLPIAEEFGAHYSFEKPLETKKFLEVVSQLLES